MNPHKSICPKIPTTWSKARKYLKSFGLTRSEQKKVLDMCGLSNTLVGVKKT